MLRQEGVQAVCKDAVCDITFHALLLTITICCVFRDKNNAATVQFCKPQLWYASLMGFCYYAFIVIRKSFLLLVLLSCSRKDSCSKHLKRDL